MKTELEIKEALDKRYIHANYDIKSGFFDGYTQAQEDMKAEMETMKATMVHSLRVEELQNQTLIKKDAEIAELKADAIGFANWINERSYESCVDGEWLYTAPMTLEYYTTEQLYELYKNQTK